MMLGFLITFANVNNINAVAGQWESPASNHDIITPNHNQKRNSFGIDHSIVVTENGPSRHCWFYTEEILVMPSARTQDGARQHLIWHKRTPENLDRALSIVDRMLKWGEGGGQEEARFLF